MRTRVRLPFDSLAVVARHGGGAPAAAIAEAIGEDLAASLARSSRLRVPRAEFVRPYAASDMSAEEIGRALNVRAVALCTIETAVDAAVELIDVVREELVARATFLVSSRELLALQRAMIRAIAPHCDGARATAWHPVTADEELYARVVYARAARAGGKLDEALSMLDGTSPVLALERAATIVEGRLHGRAGEARDALRELRGNVRGLQLQALLAARVDRDWRDAERVLREALALDAASPSTHAMLGDVLLATRRRDEAAPHHRVAAELMPLDERAQIGAAYRAYFGPQSLQAVPLLAALAPSFASANDWHVRALLAGGDVLRAHKAAVTPFGRALVAAFTRDSVYAASFTAHERALLFSAAGAADAAIDCLERCDDDAVFFAAVEPLFLPLACEPRFLALLSRLGL